MPTQDPTAASIRPGMLFCQRYRIERRIAEGGMATIYLAVDETSGLPVAIKVLFGRYSDNKVVRARFLDEGRIQAMLQHPNIVHVYQVLPEPVLSFVMEYIEGETLEEYLQREGRLNEAQVIDLMMPVMSAVGFAHSKGIVHRDIKPSNVLLHKNAGYLEPKVMDFGVAKVSRGKELTADGTTVGTLHYMSPEQIVGSRDIDGRADVYSLGCSLYKLCTGDVPFNASSEFALMMAQVEAPPKPPGEIDPEISTGMEDIILRALAKEPEHRFQTIKEMTSALIELGDEDQDRDTVTRPIPAKLLDFALGADEVALDKTDRLRLEHISDDDISIRQTLEREAISQTHELSSTAVQKIHSDRFRAARRKTGENLSLSEAETTERSGSLDDATSKQRIEELTTTERQPPDDDQRQTMEQPAGDRKTVPVDQVFERRQRDNGIVAIEQTGVDSQEVTNLMDKNELDAGVQEQRESDDILYPPLAAQSNDDITAATAADRPSLRDRLTDDDDDQSATVDERPSARRKAALQARGKDSDIDADQKTTAEDRPGLRNIEPNSSDRGASYESGDHTAVERPSKKLEGSDELPSSTPASPDLIDTSPQPTKQNDTTPLAAGGFIWIAIGLTALMLALVVLGWALFLN